MHSLFYRARDREDFNVLKTTQDWFLQFNHFKTHFTYPIDDHICVLFLGGNQCSKPHYPETRTTRKQGLEITVGEDMEKRKPSCTLGGNVKWCSHYGKQHGGSSNN